MKAYSEDLRERIVTSVISGQDIHDVAKRYQVSSRTVWRYLKQYREQGNLTPGNHPGRPPKLTPEQREILHEQLKDHPSLTLSERVKLLAHETGVKLSISTMQRWVRRLRYSRKKSPRDPSNATKNSAGSS